MGSEDRLTQDAVQDLVELYVRWGKAGGHCESGRGHGPVIYLSVSLGVAKNAQITVAPEDYPLASSYVDNYQRLRRLLERISTVNRKLFQERLLASAPQELPPGKRRRQRKQRAAKMPRACGEPAASAAQRPPDRRWLPSPGSVGPGAVLAS
jgi:hypothetical protein